jgi:hypothetical protein
LETLSISQTPEQLTSLQRLRKLEVNHYSTFFNPQSLTKLAIFETLNSPLPTTLRSLHLELEDFSFSSRLLSYLECLTKLSILTGVWNTSISSFLFRFSHLRSLTLGPRSTFEEECPSINSLQFISFMTNLLSLSLLLPFKSSSCSYLSLASHLTSFVINQPRNFNFEQLMVFQKLQRFGFRIDKISNRNIYSSTLRCLQHVTTLILLGPTDLNVNRLFPLEQLTQIQNLFIDKNSTLWMNQQHLLPFTHLRNLLNKITIYKQKQETDMIQ